MPERHFGESRLSAFLDGSSDFRDGLEAVSGRNPAVKLLAFVRLTYGLGSQTHKGARR
jgi:hypothetical protein